MAKSEGEGPLEELKELRERIDSYVEANNHRWVDPDELVDLALGQSRSVVDRILEDMLGAEVVESRTMYRWVSGAARKPSESMAGATTAGVTAKKTVAPKKNRPEPTGKGNRTRRSPETVRRAYRAPVR